jgi:hypothetical protein
MRSYRRKFIWVVTAVVVGCVVAVAFLIVPRRPVTLRIVSVQLVSGSPTARCEISNRRNKPIVLTIHSIDQTPFYNRLQRPAFSWRRVLSDWRSAVSWRPVGWDMECGIDAQEKILVPGQTFLFTASIIDTSQPIRLAVSYRFGGADFTASSPPILP